MATELGANPGRKFVSGRVIYDIDVTLIARI
jgi:hypothetical protein